MHEAMDRVCLVKRVGGNLGVEDIVRWYGSNIESPQQLVAPSYLVALDHDKKSVVLAICGTADVATTALNLIDAPKEFLQGTAHAASVDAATKILTDAKPLLQTMLQEHEGYKLVICGHSIAGGTAILLSMLILDQGELAGRQGPLPRLQCWAFAPPRVCSE